MFSLALSGVLDGYTLGIFGGTSIALIVTFVVRAIVGVGWYGMFKKVGVNPKLAFIPIVGAYQAFRLVIDDFSWAALFGATTFIAWVDAVGVAHPIIHACAVVNALMWWAMALAASHVFGMSYFFGFVYGSLPFIGVFLFGFNDSATYSTPILLLTEEERREKEGRDKKARREANRQRSKAANARPSKKRG